MPGSAMSSLAMGGEARSLPAMPPAHIALAVLCMMIWGVTFIFIKLGLDHFPPLTFAALRFALASLPFLPFYRSPGVAWRWIIGIGLFLGVGQFGLLFTGMRLGMPPGLTSIVVQTQAFFTVLFAVVVLKERPRWQNLAGLALAFAGVLVIAGYLGPIPLLPFLLVIGGAMSWGVSNILTRMAGSDDPLRLIVWASLVSPVPLLALSWAVDGQAAIIGSIESVDWVALVSLAVVAFGATNIAFALWSFLLRTHRAALVAPFALLVPLFGMSASALVFGEKLDASKLIGAALIVLGMAANSWPTRARAA
jgi:O-acetylserine/cysteine efflux transporter